MIDASDKSDRMLQYNITAAHIWTEFYYMGLRHSNVYLWKLVCHFVGEGYEAATDGIFQTLWKEPLAKSLKIKRT
jgi:hypothetical protein